MEKWRREKRRRLELAMEKMELLSPIRVLRRGYGMISGAKGDVIRSIRQVRQEARVEILLSDGRFLAQVTEIRKGGMT